jgi:hypothetical protein
MYRLQQEIQVLTKEKILQLLRDDKRAVARALVVLHERQTFDERAQEGTRYLNGRGFRPCHARMGSSMAKQFLRTGTLSDKQISYWRVPDKTGAMRIGIYWAQLLEEAAHKAKPAEPIRIADAPPEPTRDLGNDMEERLVLQEMAAGEQDPVVRAPIESRIDEIDAFWEKIRGKK